MAYLVVQKKEGQITLAEAQELEKHFLFEHIMRLAKVRALQLLAKQPA